MGESGYTSSTRHPAVSRSTPAWSSRASGKSEGVQPPAPSAVQWATSARSASRYAAAMRSMVARECTPSAYVHPTSSRPPVTSASISTRWLRSPPGRAPPASPRTRRKCASSGKAVSEPPR